MSKRKEGWPLQTENKSLHQTLKRKRRLYWINKYKTARGCDECGYNRHGVALDWDHIQRDEKEFLVSSRSLTMSLKRIFKEIRKCRLLCANCHRISTYENQHFNNNHLKYTIIPDEYKKLIRMDLT